jgi:hypothetical protein
MIKYGLPREPDENLISRWVALTEQMIAQGRGRDEAARSAAATIFPGFETCKYASVADDIESLLDAAKRRE